MLKLPQAKEEESNSKVGEDSPNTKIKKKWEFKLSLFNLHNNKALSSPSSRSEQEPEQPPALPKPEKLPAQSSDRTDQQCSTKKQMKKRGEPILPSNRTELIQAKLKGEVKPKVAPKQSWMSRLFLKKPSVKVLLPPKEDDPIAELESGKKKKKQKKKEEVQEEAEDLELMMEKICGLCARSTPVFFYKNEEQVKRLPERSLTPLLQELKEDMKLKANYLKYLKVSTRFIEACHCAEPVHAYCLSAQVTRSKKIYCPTCKEPFRYFIKEEKICDTKLLKLVALYFLVFALILLGLVGIMIFDGYLKF